MDGADTARAFGFNVPEPERCLLARGTSVLATVDGQPALMWARHNGTVTTQPAPPDVTDLDEWATRMAARLARYGITYAGRKD